MIGSERESRVSKESRIKKIRSRVPNNEEKKKENGKENEIVKLNVVKTLSKVLSRNLILIFKELCLILMKKKIKNKIKKFKLGRKFAKFSVVNPQNNIL
jgi:hypothetical protein